MNEVAEFYEKTKYQKYQLARVLCTLTGIIWSTATIDGEIVDGLTVFCEYGVTP